MSQQNSAKTGIKNTENPFKFKSQASQKNSKQMKPINSDNLLATGQRDSS